MIEYNRHPSLALLLKSKRNVGGRTFGEGTKVIVSRAKMFVFITISFSCGVVSVWLWSEWKLRMSNSCEALLSQQDIPNAFHITGTDCAIMSVSKGYKASHQTTFPPESTAVWRGRPVKVLGRNGDAIVVRDCPKCETSWLGPDASGRIVVETVPEVP